MTEVTEAEALILGRMPRFAARLQPLAACLERVLAERIVAERDQPPFDRVTMDGIAIAYRDWSAGVRAFTVVGTQAAGAPPLAISRAAQCVEVMTGAMLPGGTDTVIPVERIERQDATANVVGATVTERQYVHARGSDHHAGSAMLEPGTLLGPPEIAVVASAGRPMVSVVDLPRVAVISTGDELVDVDEPLAEQQIRSTNDRAIEACLLRRRLASVTRAHLRDDPATLLDAIARLEAQSDVLILSGGVSMGQFDYVPSVLERLGAQMVLHRVQQRPGKPMWFGVTASGKPIFALPGNPVSTLVCAVRYVLPALRKAAGLAPAAAELVNLTAPAEAFAELTYFLPVTVAWSAAGMALAEPRPTNTSGDFAALANTDGFVQLPPQRTPHAAGTVARLFRW